ncbi:MAG: hypothetical protein M1832_003442 [Thelocarpon impressellum]|nr:MAG: hypothetical protein M1832_003442 [Thelocarpon impressellum]
MSTPLQDPQPPSPRPGSPPALPRDDDGLEPPLPLPVAADQTIPLLPTEGESMEALQIEDELVTNTGRLSASPRRSLGFSRPDWAPPMVSRSSFGGLARRTLGIILLLLTVFLWTASSFLASSIFADDSYSKPFAVTYINTAFFALSLIPILVRRAREGGLKAIWGPALDSWKNRGKTTQLYAQVNEDDEEEARSKPDDDEAVPDESSRRSREERRSLQGLRGHAGSGDSAGDALDLFETARLSLEFCMLWFGANYFAAACLQYTTVGTTTILTSTSSIWTLLFGALIRVESFTIRKLVGVLASLAGIILTSTIDLTRDTDEGRGSFPRKSHRQMAVGDAMALLSAVLYGVYTILMKKRIGDEGRVQMPLFFGLVGLFNLVLLWPGFIVLDYFSEEPFELPSTGRIWAVVLMNATISLLSDFCWAYATLLTSPLVVTVGLSLTIPLSLVGQMVLQGQSSSAAYWIGAGIVFLSFIFVNRESSAEAGLEERRADEGESELATA